MAAENPCTILWQEMSQHIASSALRAQEVGDDLRLSIADGVLPGDDWQQGSVVFLVGTIKWMR